MLHLTQSQPLDSLSLWCWSGTWWHVKPLPSWRVSESKIKLYIHETQLDGYKIETLFFFSQFTIVSITVPHLSCWQKQNKTPEIIQFSEDPFQYKSLSSGFHTLVLPRCHWFWELKLEHSVGGRVEKHGIHWDSLCCLVLICGYPSTWVSDEVPMISPTLQLHSLSPPLSVTACPPGDKTPLHPPPLIQWSSVPSNSTLGPPKALEGC